MYTRKNLVMNLALTVLILIGNYAALASCDKTKGQYECEAGINDNFAYPIEAASPSLELIDWIIIHDTSGRGPINFDEIPGENGVGDNSWFAHTFNICTQSGCLMSCCGKNITCAELEMHIKLTTVNPNGGTDSIGFVDISTGTVVWNQKISSLVPGGWSTGGTQAIIVLDLDNLPSWNGVTSVLQNINDEGSLDVYIQADTGVDYMILRVECCSCPCIEPPDNLVAWWPLDENTGNISADIVGGNNGQWIGSPSPVVGKVDGALSVSGPSKHVEVPDDSDLNFGMGDFSIDCWIRTETTTGVQMFIDKRSSGPDSNVHGYALYLYNGNLTLQLSDGTGGVRNYFSSLNVTPEEWHMVAATVERSIPTSLGYLVFYVDDVNQVIISNSLPGDLTNNGDLMFGNDLFFIHYSFSGYIDEVEMFNRALTASEVLQIYQANSAGKCKWLFRTAVSPRIWQLYK